MQKAPYVFPVIGGRKVEHLHQNLEALSLSLTPEQIKTLDSVVPFEKGFPFDAFVRFTTSPVTYRSLANCYAQGDGESYNYLYGAAGHFEKWPKAEPIRPAL